MTNPADTLAENLPSDQQESPTSDLAPFSIRPKKPGFSTTNKGSQP